MTILDLICRRGAECDCTAPEEAWPCRYSYLPCPHCRETGAEGCGGCNETGMANHMTEIVP